MTSVGYCYITGLSGNSGSSARGEISLTGRAGVPNGLFIETSDSNGTLSDTGFHVVVACP